uniref:DNA-directed RNA polymerase III subunit RPC6 n=1 Tax=Timema genevievae TaxID=629358 RepID=A0A7R9PGH5_TIMGE|nr:unnamed protein product [Timema genevievae]
MDYLICSLIVLTVGANLATAQYSYSQGCPINCAAVFCAAIDPNVCFERKDLRENIRRDIQAVSPQFLAATFRNMERRVPLCLYARGGQFQHMLIIALAKASAKGISDKDIQKEIPDLRPDQRAVVINKLLVQLANAPVVLSQTAEDGEIEGYFDLFNQGGTLLYKLKDPALLTDKIKGADNEEKIVYSIIEEAGSKGIWIRDIRYKSNLVPTQLNKILKILENKKLIKAVKSVAASKKKVYMLFNLEPDRSVTGGAWYCDQDFEAEFVDVLNQQCYRYLQQKSENIKDCKGGPIAARNISYASSKDVWKFISELGISKVQLSVEDIETILDTLLYDGKVERSVALDGSYLYRAIESLLAAPGIVRIPCGVCPVRLNTSSLLNSQLLIFCALQLNEIAQSGVLRMCNDVGSVNAKKCVYMKEWLE